MVTIPFRTKTGMGYVKDEEGRIAFKYHFHPNSIHQVRTDLKYTDVKSNEELEAIDVDDYYKPENREKDKT